MHSRSPSRSRVRASIEGLAAHFEEKGGSEGAPGWHTGADRGAAAGPCAGPCHGPCGALPALAAAPGGARAPLRPADAPGLPDAPEPAPASALHTTVSIRSSTPFDDELIWHLLLSRTWRLTGIRSNFRLSKNNIIMSVMLTLHPAILTVLMSHRNRSNNMHLYVLQRYA